MRKLRIYDPALCCSTGVCGPSVDPELVRMASALFLLEGKGLDVKRYNLGMEPDAFIKNNEVNELLNKKGLEVLPITIFNHLVVKTGVYPTNEELAMWFEVNENELTAKETKENLL